MNQFSKKHSHLPVGDEIEKYTGSSKPLDCDPILWWMDRKADMPTLCKIALRVLSILPSSVSCERSFSAAGRTFNKFHAALKPTTVSDLLFVKLNKGFESWKVNPENESQQVSNFFIFLSYKSTH